MSRHTFLFLSLFLLLSIPSFSQTVKKDYLDFDEFGYLKSFKKTAPDGSWMEILNEKEGTYKYRYKLSIHRSDGAVIDACFDTGVNGYSNKEYVYKEYVEKATSFDSIINTIPYITGPATCLQPDGTVLTYGKGELNVEYISIPLSDKGDYLKCRVKEGKKYIEKNDLSEDIIVYLDKVRKTYEDCIVDFDFSSTITLNGISVSNPGTITYSDGSQYSGYIGFPNDDYKSFWYWQIATSTPKFEYTEGVLTTTDRKVKAYLKGEYSEFETAKVIQKREKEAAAKKAKEENYKKNRAEFNKKYGEKYVTALLNGNLILGTPEELFLIGMGLNAYKTYTDAKLFYKSGSTSIYHVYGWDLSSGRSLTLSNSAYLGDVKFVNGKLTSIFK